jgi:dTDP-4-amino-4,6-dideoxygalactose transaminase
MRDPQGGDSMKIPFNRPYLTGQEHELVLEAQRLGQLSGDGHFTRLCHTEIQRIMQANTALLTHSCTAALEMSALLANVGPGDEVIMPSYTFVSTANAFVLRGATPVFVDIRPDTLNIDEALIEEAITSRTRAIVPVHYAGIPCEMDRLLELARREGLIVIEDAAQAIFSNYKGRRVGALGDLGAVSFHETKNISCGEGGALLIGDDELADRARILREKGTDRAKFIDGKIDKYTWRDVGSSYLPGELTAAFLTAQLLRAREITSHRLRLWRAYHRKLEALELKSWIRRPTIPRHCQGNGHLYYVILDASINRAKVLKRMREKGIHCVSHYEPLHTSPAGLRFGRAHGSLSWTLFSAQQIIRLPLWIGMQESEVDHVVNTLESVLISHKRNRYAVTNTILPLPNNSSDSIL